MSNVLLLFNKRSKVLLRLWHGLDDPTCVRSLGVVTWPYLHPSISTTLMRPRRPHQYCNITTDIKMLQEHQRGTRLCVVCHFFLLATFDIICDLLLIDRTSTFAKYVARDKCVETDRHHSYYDPILQYSPDCERLTPHEQHLYRSLPQSKKK